MNYSGHLHTSLSPITQATDQQSLAGQGERLLTKDFLELPEHELHTLSGSLLPSDS